MNRPSSLLFALALLALSFTGTTHAATVTSMQVSPSAPVWNQLTSLDFLLSGCSLHFEDVTTTPDGATTLIVIQLDEQDCASPQLYSYRLSRYFAPGDYVVRVETPQGTAASNPFTVYDAGDAQISILLAPPTDNNPFNFTIRGYRPPCLVAETPTVENHVIRVTYRDDCASAQAAEVVQDTLLLPAIAAGDYELQVFMPRGEEMTVTSEPLRVYNGRRCVPVQGDLCLQQSRFRVRVTWQTGQGSGIGQPLPVAGLEDTGLFWFFNRSNVELTVKVLNGCGVNGHYWVFVSSGSTVGYDLEVTDTVTQQTRTYHNDLGETPALIPDTGAFATCL